MASKERPSHDSDEDDSRGSAGRVASMVRKAGDKTDMAKKGMQLRAELDELLRAEKDREAALQGKNKPATESFKLYQTLYEFKSEDPDDLSFEAGEILR